MGKNIEISEKIEKYINNFSFKLNSVQKEIIDYNNTLGNEKRMQIAISQCRFLHLIIKISNIKNILEIGTFTGLSTLAMSLALPNDGKLITIDKNDKTNQNMSKTMTKTYASAASPPPAALACLCTETPGNVCTYNLAKRVYGNSPGGGLR